MRLMRFSLKTLLAMPIAVGFLVFGVLWIRENDATEEGHGHREKQILEFVVLDARTHAPVNGATVLVQGPAEYVCPPTAVAGNTECVVEVFCESISYPLKGSEIHHMGRPFFQAKVSADGYRETFLLFEIEPGFGPEASRHKTVISLARAGKEKVPDWLGVRRIPAG